jgi:hypothetical protein
MQTDAQQSPDSHRIDSNKGKSKFIMITWFNSTFTVTLTTHDTIETVVLYTFIHIQTSRCKQCSKLTQQQTGSVFRVVLFVLSLILEKRAVCCCAEGVYRQSVLDAHRCVISLLRSLAPLLPSLVPKPRSHIPKCMCISLRSIVSCFFCFLRLPTKFGLKQPASRFSLSSVLHAILKCDFITILQVYLLVQFPFNLTHVCGVDSFAIQFCCQPLQRFFCCLFCLSLQLSKYIYVYAASASQAHSSIVMANVELRFIFRLAAVIKCCRLPHCSSLLPLFAWL